MLKIAERFPADLKNGIQPLIQDQSNLLVSGKSQIYQKARKLIGLFSLISDDDYLAVYSDIEETSGDDDPEQTGDQTGEQAGKQAGKQADEQASQ